MPLLMLPPPHRISCNSTESPVRLVDHDEMLASSTAKLSKISPKGEAVAHGRPVSRRTEGISGVAASKTVGNIRARKISTENTRVEPEQAFLKSSSSTASSKTSSKGSRSNISTNTSDPSTRPSTNPSTNSSHDTSAIASTATSITSNASANASTKTISSARFTIPPSGNDPPASFNTLSALSTTPPSPLTIPVDLSLSTPYPSLRNLLHLHRTSRNPIYLSLTATTTTLISKHEYIDSIVHDASCTQIMLHDPALHAQCAAGRPLQTRMLMEKLHEGKGAKRLSHKMGGKRRVPWGREWGKKEGVVVEVGEVVEEEGEKEEGGAGKMWKVKKAAPAYPLLRNKESERMGVRRWRRFMDAVRKGKGKRVWVAVNAEDLGWFRDFEEKTLVSV